MMEPRADGFLNPKRMPEDVFDYIQELHALLWRATRVAYPGASGDLSRLVESAIEKLERDAAVVPVPTEIDRAKHGHVLLVWNDCMVNHETLEMTWPKLVKAMRRT